MEKKLKVLIEIKQNNKRAIRLSKNLIALNLSPLLCLYNILAYLQFSRFSVCL